MHIVFDARFFRSATGGIGRYTRALIRELALIDRTNRYTIILTPADKDEWEIFVRANKLDETRWRSYITSIGHYTYAEQVQLGGIIKSLKPDLVHFTNFNHPITYSAPFIATIHDLTILNYPVGARQQSFIAQRAFRAVVQHALSKAKAVITVSETSKEDLVRRFRSNPDEIIVTYEGVDAEYQPVNLPQRGRVQQQLKEQLGVRLPYLLFVSQWRPHKGILTLLDAYDAFRSRQTKLRPQLVITGRPNADFPEIPKRIEASPYASDILRPGFVNDDLLPHLYQGAEAFVFPSEYEGFGLTPLEAMACGAPVLASDTSCLPEILGDAAILVPPKDIDAWVNNLEKLLTNHLFWRDMRAKSLARARMYSWRKMAEETLAVYARVLK